MRHNSIICKVCSSKATELWCRAKDVEYSTSDKIFFYFSCQDCGSIFIDPIPDEDLRKIYPPNYYSFLVPPKNIIAYVKEYLDQKLFKRILGTIGGLELKILDIGGGTGWITDLIKRIDKRIILTQIIDIDEKSKEIAEAKGHKYFTGTLEDFETSEKYDLVLMINLIEHVRDPISVLKKAESLLTHAGKILVKTPNTDSFDCRFFRRCYWGGLHAPRHWVIFSETGFRESVCKRNLKISYAKHTQGGAFWAFSILFILSEMKLVKLDSNRPMAFHALFPFLSAVFAALDYMRRPFSSLSQVFYIIEHTDSKLNDEH